MFNLFIGVVLWFVFFVVIEYLGELELVVINVICSIFILFFVIVNLLVVIIGLLVSNLLGVG